MDLPPDAPTRMPSGLTILPDPPPPPTPIGLIAGGGRLPGLIAEHLQRQGHPVHALGLGKAYEHDLPPKCDTFQEVGLLRVGGWAKRLSRLGVKHAVMVGRVDKAALMHDPWRLFRNIPDIATMTSWYRYLRHDRRSHAVLTAIAEILDRKGVSLIDSTAPIPEQLATTGVMTRTQPTPEQRADVEFVWPLLNEILRLDIGQAIAVRERDVISVEAVEGTDRMIERTGTLCRSVGWSLCKGARAGHDRRSDVPTVGIETIETMHAHGGRCLALAEGDVIMLDKPVMLERADELGIAVVGIPAARSVSEAASNPDGQAVVSVETKTATAEVAEALTTRQ